MGSYVYGFRLLLLDNQKRVAVNSVMVLPGIENCKRRCESTLLMPSGAALRLGVVVGAAEVWLLLFLL